MVSIYGIPPRRDNNHGCYGTPSLAPFPHSTYTCAHARRGSSRGTDHTQAQPTPSADHHEESFEVNTFSLPALPQCLVPHCGPNDTLYGASSLPLYQYRGYVSIFHLYLHTGPPHYVGHISRVKGTGLGSSGIFCYLLLAIVTIVSLFPSQKRRAVKFLTPGGEMTHLKIYLTYLQDQ